MVEPTACLDGPGTLVLVFGSSDLLEDDTPLRSLGEAFPGSAMIGCSTSGEILDAAVDDGSLAVAVARFERTAVALEVEPVSQSSSADVGRPVGKHLEITEDFLMADRARNILTRLRRNGVQISIDDFGTGYSSLAYMRDLPIDELKLDRSFIFPMADDAHAAALVASTIELAHSLGCAWSPKAWRTRTRTPS